MSEDVICEVCDDIFSSVKNLEKHRKDKRHYRDVLFTCLRCQYKTTRITHFDEHKCKNNTHPFENYEELLHRLNVEMAKNEVYQSVVKGNDLKEKESHIAHKPLPQQQPEKKGSSYRQVKIIELVPEKTEDDIELSLEIAEATRIEMLEQFSDPKDAEEVFKSSLESLKTSRMYTKTLEHLKVVRFSLIGSMTTEEYKSLVHSHINQIKEIMTEKKYNEARINKIILSCLNPIEQRMIFFEGYHTSHIDVDDLQKYNISLSLNTKFDMEFVPFISSKFYDKFLNYGTVLFPILDNVVKYIANVYEFYNVIYLPLPKSSKEDPFSFYILESVYKGKRKWRMDCRLEELMNGLVTNIQPYLISIFRRIYYDLFHHNDYHRDYMTKNQILECDCEQLVQNILLLSDSKKLSMKLRKTIVENCTYQPTENDKFNLYGDDVMQRQRMEKIDTDLVEVVKLLFDEISSEEAVDFYRKRK